MKVARLVLLAAAISLLAPVAAADVGDVVGCEGPAVQRAICAAKETVEEVTEVADPIVVFAGEEVRWASATTCAVVDHVVGPVCRSIAFDDPVVLA